MIVLHAVHVLVAAALLSRIVLVVDAVNVYVADLLPFNGSSVIGKATVFVDDENNGLIGYGGYAMNVATSSLSNSQCSKYTNGCGVHIHDGFACDNTTVQGGHYYEATSKVTGDPWINERFTSNANGYATYSNVINIGTDFVVGKPFVVHSEDGSRIACGLLESVNVNDIVGSDLKPFNSSGVKGAVTGHRLQAASNQYFTLQDLFCFYVVGQRLTANIASYLTNNTSSDCNVTNGCGVHVHAGTSCDSITSQMGHYYNNQTFATDPWILVNYDTTDDKGTAYATHCVATGETTFLGQAFVLHDPTGKRVSCGLLQEGSPSSTANGSPSSTSSLSLTTGLRELLPTSIIITTMAIATGWFGMLY